MASVNRVILIGHLGADPEVRYTQGGQAVASLRIATSESWTDKDGQKQERTEWHQISVWGKEAEACGQYLSKGRQVYVEGRLQTREYQDKEGVTRKVWEIRADRVQFLGGGQRDGGEASDRGQSGGGNAGGSRGAQGGGGGGSGGQSGGARGGARGPRRPRGRRAGRRAGGRAAAGGGAGDDHRPGRGLRGR